MSSAQYDGVFQASIWEVMSGFQRKLTGKTPRRKARVFSMCLNFSKIIILSLQLVGLHEDCKETANRKGVPQHHCGTVPGEAGRLANPGLLVDVGAVSPECTERHVVIWIYS